MEANRQPCRLANPRNQAYFSTRLPSKHNGTGRVKAVTDGACLELAGKLPRENPQVVGADERALIRRAQEGDRAAFEDLVRIYDQKVLRLAFQLMKSGEEARDIYQEVFLKVYRSLSQFRFQSSFSTWLHRVVTNVCLDHFRRSKSREEAQPEPKRDDGGDLAESVAEHRPMLNPEHALRAREISQRIERALTRLSPRERMVFELRHYQGLRLRAIGEVCGTSEETAKNCLFRATQKLRGALSDLV